MTRIRLGRMGTAFLTPFVSDAELLHQACHVILATP